MKHETLDRTETSNPEAPARDGDTSLWGASRAERMRWLRKTAREHVWGPFGSFLFHLVLIVLAVHLFQRPPPLIDEGITVILDDPVLPKFDPPPPVEPEPPRPDTVAPDFVDPAFTEGDDLPEPTQPEIGSSIDIPDVPPVYILAGVRPGGTEGGRLKALGASVKGNPAVYEAHVRRALEWLKDHQLADGSWEGEGSARCKTAMTGLALLAFLAHGETPNSEAYGATVERAIRFLVETDARADGTFTHADGSQYAQGIAAYALAEAFTLTRIASIKPVLEAAIARILAGQQSTGAFNYQLLASDTRRDTSVAGWMTQAMKAAHIGGARVAGLPEAMDLAAQGLKANFRAEESLFQYAPGNPGAQDEGGVSPSVTPIGALCLQLLGRAQDPEVAAAVRSLSSWQAVWTEKHPSAWPLYTWYYATQAFFNAGEGEWKRWYEPFARMLIHNQNADGSWTPNGASEGAYGPVYGTVFSALTLMTPYRYLPMFRQIREKEAAPAETDEDDIFAGLTLSRS